MKSAFLDRGRVKRAPRLGRGARRTILAVAMLLTVAAAVVVVIVHHDRSQAFRDPYQPLPPESTTCGANPVREPCLDIYVPAAGNFRYALLKAPTPTPDTVIVDFGGPGLAVLSGAVNLGAFQGTFTQLSHRYNILVLEEPWVTQVPPDDCATATSRLYQAVHDRAIQITDRAAAMAKACGLALPEFAGNPVEHIGWGFDPAKYGVVVDAITARHELAIKGFVAQSWGSVRLAYLSRTDLEFAVLVRPFPVGADARTLQRHRTEAINRTLPAPVHTISATQLDGRSPPVNHVDQLSAIIELGYVDDEYFNTTAMSVLTGKDAAEIGRLSDELWTRYGQDTLSPARLAEWQEVCGAVALPPTLRAGIHSIPDVLAAGFAPCHALQVHKPPQVAARHNCIVTSALDTVTPQKLIQEQYAFIAEGHITWIESKQRSHTSLDGLTECLTKTLP